MKNITVILILSMLGGSDLIIPENSEIIERTLVENFSCPQTNDVSTLVVTALLLHYFQETNQKQNFGMDLPSNSRSEIENILEYGAETPQKLREYWRKKGFKVLSDSTICTSITEALTRDENLMIDYEEFRSEYFQLGTNRYLVIFLPKQTRLSHRKFPSPLVLDENFRVVRKLDLE